MASTKPQPGKVRVVSGDNKTGYVDKAKLATAKAQGWREATEEEASAKKQRREASSVGGTIQGGAEAVFRGASMGGTDLLLEGLGVEGVGARAEALGEIGTGLEVGGAVAASIATGGGGAVVQGAGRGAAAVTAKQLAKRGLGAIAAPTKYAAKAGSAVERMVLGGIEAAEASAGRRVAASVAGAATEGSIGGVAGVVSESVIKDKPLTAEAIVGGALAGAAFDGTLSGGASLAGVALGRVMRGLHPKTGKPVSDASLREVLGADAGVAPSTVADGLVAAAKTTEPSMLGSIAEKLAPFSGADSEVARRVFTKVQADPEKAHRLLTRGGEVEQEIAQTFQDGLGQIRDALDTTRKISGGEAKYKTLGNKMPKNADFVAPRYTEKMRDGFSARITAMRKENTENFGQAYDVGAVREIDALVGRAFNESAADAVGETQSSAVRSFRAIDRLKHDLGEVVRQTGGWGAPRPGTTTDVVAANKAAREMYAEAQKHLEREDLFGANAVAQREVNAAYSAVARAESDFKSGVPGSGLTKLFNPDGTVSMRQAITLGRQYGRMGGEEVVTKLDGAMQAQVDYLRVVQKHYDIGPEGASKLKAAEDAVEQIRAKFRNQADDAAFLDDLHSLRDSESAGSVSMGAMSTLGPTVGGLIGGATLGPLGAAAGAVIGGVMRPYTTARHMAALLSMTNRFGARFDGSGMVAKLRTGYGKAKAGAAKRISAAKVPQRATAAAKGLKLAAAFQLGKLSAEDKAKGIERIGDQLSKLSSPDELEKILGPEFGLLSEDAPETATAIHETIARLTTFLQANLPRVYKDPFTGRAPIVNAAEADRFIRITTAALDPRSVVRSFEDGTLTGDQARALREVYPATFQAMSDGAQSAIMEAAESGEPIPYKGRVRLTVLLGIPMEPLMRPANMRRMQALYGAAEQPEQPQTQPAASQAGGRRLKTTGSIEAVTTTGPSSMITATRKQRV